MHEFLKAIEIGVFFILIAFLFIHYELYASATFWVALLAFILAMTIEFFRHFIVLFLVVIFSALYLPFNFIVMHVGAQVAKFKKKDPFLYWLFFILLLPIQTLTAILSIPYELVLGLAH